MIIQPGVVDAVVVSATDAEHRWVNDFLSFDTQGARFSGAYQSGAWDGKTRLYSLLTKKFPAGLIPLVRRGGLKAGMVLEVLPSPARVAADPTADISWLDPKRDQPAAVAACLKFGRGIVEAPTGSGKTELFVALTVAVPAKWLILAPSIDLMGQAAARYELRVGQKCGRIGDGIWEVDGHRVVASTFQTLAAGIKSHSKKVIDFLATIEAVAFDECFPAGTLVAGKPIEEIKAGDVIPSWDEVTQSVVTRRVLRVFHRVVTTPLVRVEFSDGRNIISTPGHPFLTPGGWLPAGSLSGQCVLHIPDDMHYLREGCHAFPFPDPRHQEESAAPGGVFRAMSAGLERETPFRRIVSGAFSTNAGGAKPHEQSGFFSKGYGNSPNAGGLGASSPGWKRSTPSSTPTELAECFGGLLESRNGSSYETAIPLPPELQNRPGIPRSHAGDRSRRGVTPNKVGPHSGCQENPLLNWARVDRVEILESGSSARHGFMPSGNSVYNLHVEGTETYVVNGAVVHNCHMLAASSFLGVARRLKNASWRLGFSGTPLARGDQKSVLLVGQTGPVIHKTSSQTLIDAGVLSKPKIRFVPLNQPGVPGFMWTDVYKAGVVLSESRNALLGAIAQRAAKPALLFVKDIAHGRSLLKLCSALGLKSDFVWGNNSAWARKYANTRLAGGDLDLLIASTIYDQGIDIPELKSVIVGTGGKSAIKALQRLGRGMRIAEGKTQMELWDVKDIGHPWLERQSAARLAIYAAQGYEVLDGPL